MKRGVATFTLDGGHAPRYLFERMVRLGREMVRVLVEESGPDEFVKRIADPVWFQSFGTVLAFDWNASGLTTVLTGALKESIKGREKDLGVFICGGKGRASRKTPDQIAGWSEVLNFSEDKTKVLIRNSKMSAKVDSSVVQDGYQLYHHTFFFSKNGYWTVVQQGMNTINKTARRYHWHDRIVENSKLGFQNSEVDFVNEPHSGIASQKIEENVLNMSDSKSLKARNLSVYLAGDFRQSQKDFEILRKYENELTKMIALRIKGEEHVGLKLRREDFYHHSVESEDFSESRYLKKILQKVSEIKPKTYEKFVEIEGVGPKTLRSLALVSEVIYGAKPSYEDPARYSFAHGGKDGFPYPVDRKSYDRTINMLSHIISKSTIENSEKNKALKRLDNLL